MENVDSCTAGMILLGVQHNTSSYMLVCRGNWKIKGENSLGDARRHGIPDALHVLDS